MSWSTIGDDAGLSLHLKNYWLSSVTTVWAEKKKSPHTVSVLVGSRAVVAEDCVREEGECSWVCLWPRIAVAALPYIIDRVKNGSKFVMERAGGI